jgi:hypothetical protein
MSSRTWRGRFVVAFLLTVALRPSLAAEAPKAQSPNAEIASLWVNPSDLESRDLFYGPGGRDLVPAADAVYRFQSEDKTGHSGGYKVTDPRDREWKIKIGDEVQSEIAVSRILWAIGYHQPVMHYVARWQMTGGPEAKSEPGRFRLESDHKKDGDWSWDDNPFLDAQPFRGLVAVNLLGILAFLWPFVLPLAPGVNENHRSDGPVILLTLLICLGAVLFVAGWCTGRLESPPPRSIEPPRLREFLAVTI